MAEKDQPALVAQARKYGTKPGRGIAKSVMVKCILVATGQAAPVKKTTKRAPAKKTTRARKATKRTAPRRLTVVNGRHR